MVNLHSSQLSLRFSTKALLAAAALAGASLLAACGDSSTAEAAKNAVKNSEESARWAQSAGDFRAKPELAAKEFVVDRDEPGNTRKNAQNVSNALKATIEKDTTGKEWQKYLLQNDALADLQKSEEIVSKSLTPSVPVSALLKSSLNTQLAEAQLSEARINISRSQSEVQKLTAQVNNVMLTLQQVGGLASAAAALDAQKDAAVIKEKAAAAAAAATAADSAQADAAAELKKLQDQKADIDRRAAEAQKNAEDQFAAGDKMKLNNKAAMAAYDAAIAEGQKTYGQATALRNESALLEPQIANATADVQLSEHRTKEAHAVSDALKNAAATLGTARTGATEQATAIRTQIDELMKGPAGLTARIEALKLTAAAGEKASVDAAAKAAAAKNAFGLAATNQAAADKELANKVKELGLDAKPEDPLTKLSTRRDDVAVLHILEASASNALGEAKLTGFVIAGLRDLVDDHAKKSLTPAKQPVPADIAAANKALGAEATDAFKKAIELANSNVGAMTNQTKWIADYVIAVGNYGVSVAAADSNTGSTAIEAARTAAKAAIDKNPALTFPGLFAAKTPRKSTPTPEKGGDMGHDVPPAP